MTRPLAYLAALVSALLLTGFTYAHTVTAPDRQRTVGPRTYGTGQIAWRRIGPEKWAYRHRTALVEIRDGRGRVTRLGRRVRELRDSRAALRARVLTLRREVARSQAPTRALSGRSGDLDWLGAVGLVSRYYPAGAWLRSCSASEGDHGRWVPNTQGSGAGGWMQFMEGTWRGFAPDAFTDARRRGMALEPRHFSWYSPVGQAVTGAYMYVNGLRGHWVGAGC